MGVKNLFQGVFGSVLKFGLVILIIASFFIKLDTTASKEAELLEPSFLDAIALSQVDLTNNVEMIKTMYDYRTDKYEVTEDLGVFSGVKNGVFVVIGFFRDTIVGFVLDYIAGFHDKGLIGKVLWLVLGFFYAFIVNIFASFFGMFGLAFGLLTQSASMGYYVVYVISFIITLVVTFGFTDSWIDS